MQSHEEPQSIAGGPAAQNIVTEESASNEDEYLSMDPAAIPEVPNNHEREIAAWKNFADDPAAHDRQALRAARARERQNQESSVEPFNKDWKGMYIRAEKGQRALEKELRDEKAVSAELRAELVSAHEANDELYMKLLEVAQQMQAVNTFKSKLASLQAEVERLRKGVVEPQEQASESKAESPTMQPAAIKLPSTEPPEIQKLDDNMGIDSDQEEDDFASDDESSEKADEKSGKGSIDHEDEAAEAET